MTNTPQQIIDNQIAIWRAAMDETNLAVQNCIDTAARLEAIIANNKTPRPAHGTLGGMQVMLETVLPGRTRLKRSAAECIRGHRNCVKANREIFGREYKGTFWLDRAATFRRLAAQAPQS